MKKTMGMGVGLLVLLTTIGFRQDAAAQMSNPPAGQVPVLQVDPTWNKPLPNSWVLGQVAAVTVDAQDNVWLLHRFRSVKPELKAAPPVVVFDSAGNFVKAWGGPGEGYDWPGSEHGLFIDYKGFVWIGGECRGCNQILKFTPDGKFVMQIGKVGQSSGHKDTENLVGPTDVYVYPKSNELFVGDTGSGRGRVVVMDADTGKFKRMWAGFGNPPADLERGAPPDPEVDTGGDPQQLHEAHRVRVSNDGMVYVADGPNKRFQVFTVDGKFVKQVYVERGKKPASVVPITTINGFNFEYVWGESYRPVALEQLINHHETSSGVALSTDPDQTFLYVYERSTSRGLIFDRKSLTQIGEFGNGPGRAPGQFFIMHDIRVDSRGNVYVAEVNIGSRVQKFLLKGYMTPLK